MPYRCDRNRFCGRVIVYVRDDILNKQLIKHTLPEDMEGAFVDVNLRKTKWLRFGEYGLPCKSVEYFFKHVGFALDTYRQVYEKFLFAGDFNSLSTNPTKWPQILKQFFGKNHFSVFDHFVGLTHIRLIRKILNQFCLSF